ncbi:MAG TPA: hypothetical protein PK431_02830 [Chitinophagales bacterium]|jgi:iron-sulfur cluster repair protein YtfE (RIC family)|nr:hypothetical protein [Saprospirales bacterium]HUM50715.1 hypothetical protein [Chitinophagales bacterium]
MQNLHVINYNDFLPSELCLYLEERHYVQILSDLASTKKYIENLISTENIENGNLIQSLFIKLEDEIKNLFVKDRILLFPHIIKNYDVPINLAPINLLHQRISTILQKLRSLMNNYIQQPSWSNQYKICCNELYSLEENIRMVLYIKENYLWIKLNSIN